MSKRMMHLGVYVQIPGNHISGWRRDDAAVGGTNLPLLQGIARTAEKGHLDFIFFADSYGYRPDGHPAMNARFEPTTLISALAMSTSHVGLAATVCTTYSEPFTVARAVASVDHLSGGRAAWNVVTGSVAADAGNFNKGSYPEHDQRYEIAEEFVDVVRGLWDGWEEGALVADKASGQYLDTTRIHPLNHSGRFYSVRGPLNMPRPPQGNPVIIQAGSSGPGQALAARTADVIFTAQLEKAAAQQFYAGFKSRVREFGRDADNVKLLPGLVPYVGRTRQEARDQLAALQDQAEPSQAFAVLAHRLGHDVSGYPLDGPVPDLPKSNGLQYNATVLLQMARRDGLTLRDLYHLVVSGTGMNVVCGTPSDIADLMEEWVTERAADGFILMPPWYPGPLEMFVAEVVPELTRRGLFRADYNGPTLRHHLGIAGKFDRRELAANS